MSDHSTENTAASNFETIENALNSLSLEDVRLEGGLSAKRMEVLKGSFASTTSFPGNEWKAPDFKLYVFVSSTFDDTQIERNIIQQKIAPYLRNIGDKHAIQVIFMDMRWGIRDESTLEHNTWTDCRRGMDLCHEKSSGICFLSLQSHRYGSRFPPKDLPHDEFSRVVNGSDASEEVKNLFR